MRDYIITVHNSNGEESYIYRFRGEIEDVKEKLMELVNQDKNSDIDNWDYGTDGIEYIEKATAHGFYAYNVFTEYHIDYTAVEFCDVNFI